MSYPLAFVLLLSVTHFSQTTELPQHEPLVLPSIPESPLSQSQSNPISSILPTFNPETDVPTLQVQESKQLRGMSESQEELKRFFAAWLASQLNPVNPSVPSSSSLNCSQLVAPSNRNICQTANLDCFSEELLGLEKPLDVEHVQNWCPLLFYQAQQGICNKLITTSSTFGSDVPQVVEAKTTPDPKEVWLYGFLFVTLISLSSLVGVSVLPLMGKKFYNRLLTLLVGLAVGSLSGSSVFHLVPQAFGLMTSDPEHHYLNTSALIWAGFWLFFMIERMLKMTMDFRSRASEDTQKAKKVVVPLLTVTPNMDPEGNPAIGNGNGKAEHRLSTEIERIYESQEQVIKASFGHQHKPHPSHSHEGALHWRTVDGEGKANSTIATVAWMIIFGDGFHNFIDGLSLGAAFNESLGTGISISIAVLCEELPHELGDFAVLLSAGMTMRQALLYNFLSACTCYVGLAIGILLGEVEASTYIFALAAGMFLYISLVDMVPEMNEVSEAASKTSFRDALEVLGLQNLGMLAGVAALYVMARFQDSIQIGGG